MEENKNATPADAQDEPIITPAHLAELLPQLKTQMQSEGETAPTPALSYRYMVALVEYAIQKGKDADELQEELDRIVQYEGMKMCRNGGESTDL